MPRRDKRGGRRSSNWVVDELAYSARAPLAMAKKADRYGLKSRYVLPIFVDCERNFAQFEIPSSIAYIAKLNAEFIDYAGWPTAVGPLIDRIAVLLGRKKRPDADRYPDPDPAKARTQPLADAELTAILNYKDYVGWYVDNFGNAEVRYLVKTFKFPHFNQAADFMELVRISTGPRTHLFE